MKGSPKIFENQAYRSVVAEVPDGGVEVDEVVPHKSELEGLDAVKECHPTSKLLLGDSEIVGRASATRAKRNALNLTEAVKARLLVGNTIDMLADAIVREMLTGNTGIIKEMFNRVDGPVQDQSVSYSVKVELTPEQQMQKIQELTAKAKRRMYAQQINSEDEESEGGA